MLEKLIAEIEREWIDLRNYFLPFDRYVHYRVSVNGDNLDYVLGSLIVHDRS